MLERVRMLSDTAFGRRVKDRVLPDTDDLNTRLRRKTAELDVPREKLKRYRDLLGDLTKLLHQMEEKEDDTTPRGVQRINNCLLVSTETTVAEYPLQRFLWRLSHDARFFFRHLQPPCLWLFKFRFIITLSRLP